MSREITDNNGTGPEVLEMREKDLGRLHSGWRNQGVDLDPFIEFWEPAE